MKSRPYIDILEDMALNMEKMDENFILMKEQISEFKSEEKLK